VLCCVGAAFGSAPDQGAGGGRQITLNSRERRANHEPRAGGRWRLPLFQSVLPLNRSGLAVSLAAGISLAAMNIPQAMGYAKIAGTPVNTHH